MKYIKVGHWFVDEDGKSFDSINTFCDVPRFLTTIGYAYIEFSLDSAGCIHNEEGFAYKHIIERVGRKYHTEQYAWHGKEIFKLMWEEII